MPLLKIELREGRTADSKKRLLDVVHGALIDIFEIPDADRTLRIVEYSADSFNVPPGSSDDFLLVTIDVLPGRSVEAKKALYAGIVGGLGDLGVDPQDVFIILNEVPLENWAVRGGQAAVDVASGSSIA